MNLKIRKVTTVQIEGEGVLDCPEHRWNRPIISYDGERFGCGCQNCGIKFVNENLYMAVSGWNRFAETRAERIVRGYE